MKTFKTFTLLLATSALVAPRAFAQNAEADDFPLIDPVVWDGDEPENAWVAELPIVTQRGAGDLADKALTQWQDMLLKKFDQFVQPVNGQSNPREAAYTMLNVFIGSSLMGAAGTTLAGAGGGALLGGIITSESGGWGAAPGLALGGGAGLTVGSAQIATTVIASMVIADEIETRYPYENGGVRARDISVLDGESIEDEPELWEDPPEWIVEDMLAAEAMAASDDAGAIEASSVDERSIDRRKRRARPSTSRSRGRSRYAGAQESLFIHVIGELVAPKARDLARHWDRMPGLSRSQKAQLKKFEQPLRSWVKRLDYIRTNRRLSANAPEAMPLSAWQKSALMTLSGSGNTEVWLDAFAIGNTKVSVNGSNATWTTPRVLRSFGAPKSFRAKIGSLHARVKGFGGELSGKITPGKFDIEVGSLRVDGSKLRVGFRVRSGKSLATVSVKGKLGGASKTLMTLSPKLSSSLRGDLFFKLSGTGLVVDSVKVGGLKLNLGMKKITNPLLAPLDGLRKQLEKKLQSEMSKLLGNSFDWSRLFGSVKNYAPKQLLDILNKSCDELGVAQVKSLRGITARKGRLDLRVEAMTWKGAPKVDHRRYGKHVQRMFR